MIANVTLVDPLPVSHYMAEDGHLSSLCVVGVQKLFLPEETYISLHVYVITFTLLF